MHIGFLAVAWTSKLQDSNVTPVMNNVNVWVLAACFGPGE